MALPDGQRWDSRTREGALTPAVPALGRLWATLMLLSLSLHLPGLGLVPIGAMVALWHWNAIRSLGARSGFRPARLLLIATATAIVFGAALRFSLIGDALGTLGGIRPAVEVVLWLAAFPLMTLGGLLAMQVLGLQASAWRLGLGSLFGGVSYVGLDSPNLWKFVLAYPVALLAFWAVARARSQLPALLVCGGLIVLSTINATRNTAGAAALTAVLVVAFASRSGTGPSPGGRLVALAATGVAGVTALLLAMREGFIGSAMAEQYARQTEGGQNVFLGGRVEWNVTVTLAEARPWGFGIGTNPNIWLQSDAIRAVARAGGDPNREYYNFAVFGDRVDVHSIAGTLWFHAGAGGLFLAGVIAFVLAWGAISASLATSWSPGARAFLFFAVAQAGWDLLFSPMAQIDHVTIGMAVALLAATSRTGTSCAPAHAS